MRRTVAVWAAAVLACIYAMVLVTVAAILCFDGGTGRGTVGSLKGSAENRGVAFFITVCVIGAGALVWGSVRAWRGARGFGAIIPCAVVVAIGCVGEPIDILAGNSLSSNLIGAIIIVLAATPIVLLLLPRKRRTADEGDA
jgi:hypothetical protein